MIVNRLLKLPEVTGNKQVILNEICRVEKLAFSSSEVLKELFSKVGYVSTFLIEFPHTNFNITFNAGFGPTLFSGIHITDFVMAILLAELGIVERPKVDNIKLEDFKTSALMSNISSPTALFFMEQGLIDYTAYAHRHLPCPQ